MGRGGRKYRLLFYEYMLNRWWPVTFWLAFFIFLNVGVLWGAEFYFKTGGDPLPLLPLSGGLVMLAVAVICLFFTLFLLVIRRMAYVQLFDDHFRIVTPSLRLNVSYNRLQTSVISRMAELFASRRLSSRQRQIIEPVLGNTVVVLHLSSYPIPRSTLGLFLSPFFFSDNTPHFVLMVDDWLSFSTELDSKRSASRNTRRPALRSPHGSYGLLDDLKHK